MAVMKKHIFLVDDDRDEMRIFYEALNELPGAYKCTCASSMEQTLEMLKYLTPDYIIADFHIPPTNGLELFNQVKNIKRLKDIPFILYSSKLTDEIIHQANELGVSKCVKKPDSIARMSNLLHHLLVPDLMHN